MNFKIALFNIAIAMFFFACDGGSNTSNNESLGENNDSGLLEGENSNQWDNDKQNEFVKTAANVNLMEIKAGETAQNKAQQQDLKDYGQTLVNDHKNANQKLQSLAQNMNVQLPDQLDEKHQDKVNELQNANNDEFRKKFLDMMVKDHEETINKFEDAQENLQDGELKTYVDNTLPVLRRHLEKAQQLQNQNQNQNQ